MGGGVSIITCPNEALRLERKGADEISIPAKDFTDMMIKIGQEKGRL